MNHNLEIRSVIECMNRGIIVVDEQNLEVQFENPCAVRLLSGNVNDKILVSGEDGEYISIIECCHLE